MEPVSQQTPEEDLFQDLPESSENLPNTEQPSVSCRFDQPSTSTDFDNSHGSKRKNDDICLNNDKKRRSDESDDQMIDFDCSFDNSPDESEDIDALLAGLSTEIDELLMQTAQKNKLTTSNVKSILRHVISNQYVLAMVRNTMKAEEGNGEELEEAVYEPKLTRSKAKELRQKHHKLPWPVSTPVKQSDEAAKELLYTEFSEEESDDDYEPNDEEPISEEDVPSTSSIIDLDCSSVLSPDDKNQPMIDSNENNSVVDDLSELNIPQPSLDMTEADKIALRTRSKFCLNKTKIKDIEASFNAPDASVDMYSVPRDNEDWQNFLRDLQIELGDLEQPTEDNCEDDPEYNFLADLDDLQLDNIDEICNDKTSKVSKKELNALMTEILESGLQEVGFDHEDENATLARSESDKNMVLNVVQNVVQSHSQGELDLTSWIRPQERLQIEEQMRMHVQLLTQTFLLSHGHEEFSAVHETSKAFLRDIKTFAGFAPSSSTQSAFHSCNLDEALEIVNSYDNSKEPVHNVANTIKSGHTEISHRLKKTMAESKVFIYPRFLPLGCYRIFTEPKPKPIFTPAEDNLIAMGLDQFGFMNKRCIGTIQNLLVPTKSDYQIRIRVKNSRSMKAPTKNPIKHYYRFKKAPEITPPWASETFDLDSVKAPKDQLPDLLPKWVEPFIEVTKKKHKPISCDKVKPKSPTTAIQRPILPKTPEKRQYSQCPLRQISPILKKYSQHRGPYKQRRFPPRPIRPKPYFISVDKIMQPKVLRVIPISPMKVTDVNSSTGNSAMAEHNASLVASSSSYTRHVKPVVINLNHERASTSTSSSKSPLSSNVNINNLATTRRVIDLRSAKLHSLGSKIQSSAKALEISKESKLQRISRNSDEEPIDDVHDLAELMAASTKICKKQQPPSKKRNRLQKDMEASLQLLQPNLVESDPKRDEREILFANAYMLRVHEKIKDDPILINTFLATICEHPVNSRPVELFFKLKDILKDYPSLMDEFAGFLSADQAMECGKYKEYMAFYKIREFLRKLEVHFRDQPQHLLKILKTFGKLSRQTGLTSAKVISLMQPLLRNQTHLMEELTTLLPDAPPPSHLMENDDFEEMNIPNSDDNSSIDSCEEFVVPETSDLCGGKECPCDCHLSSNPQNRNKHCAKCGLRSEASSTSQSEESIITLLEEPVGANIIEDTVFLPSTSSNSLQSFHSFQNILVHAKDQNFEKRPGASNDGDNSSSS